MLLQKTLPSHENKRLVPQNPIYMRAVYWDISVGTSAALVASGHVAPCRTPCETKNNLYDSTHHIYVQYGGVITVCTSSGLGAVKYDMTCATPSSPYAALYITTYNH